ncbi:MAG: DUF1501 domain-containing protein [Rhizobiaceae bacterium]|nr:DUF1501 domain-containing protein [Rhizobiaceae bacterium]
MAPIHLSRRSFLASACCLAASPLMTPLTFAAVPGERRFITIVLRGALDSLYMLQPHADPLLARYRPDLTLDPAGLLDLDGHFGLHGEAADLLPLWKNGELAFVNAVSTPYRDQRSHFDGQDILESGGADPGDERTGWLNRALAAIPRPENRKAIDVHTSAELILSGPNPVDTWSSDSDLAIKPDELTFFQRLYGADPDFAKAFDDAKDTDKDADNVFAGGKRSADAAGIARLAAGMLKGDYRLASFSIGGWDTHIGQANIFRKPLRALVTALTTLKAELGPDIWNKTAILAMTEFGRTVRQNGSKGTDHGTGGLAVIAGGVIRGGQLYGRWPGLAENQLFEGRDLMPTTDVREIAAALLHSQFDIAAGDLTSKIFPGLSLDLRSQPYLRA